MRLRTFIALLILVAAGIGFATFTNSMDGDPTSWYWTGGTKDTGLLWAREVEDYLDGTTGVVVKNAVEVFDANDTLTAAETGKVCVSDGKGSGDLVLTLPAAAAGLTYTFYDANATAGDDLWITAGTGDTINGGTAAKSYKCTGDAVKQHVTLVAADATRWVIVAENGTWANDNN